MRVESRVRACVVILLCANLFGCLGRTSTSTLPTEPAASDVVPDDSASVASLETAGAKLKKDGHGNVTEVDFRGTSIGDDALQHLNGLHSVRSLMLNDTAVTDVCLETVGRVTPLTNLDLRGCKVTNSGIGALTGLSNLKALRLSGKSGKTSVTDDAMDSIAKLTKLKVLSLDFLKFTSGEDGLKKLNGLSEMQELYIGNTLVNDDSLAVITTQFPRLKKLRVAAGQVSDVGLEQIAKLPELTELDLSENGLIFDSGLVHLSKMKQLKKLNLWRVPITDEGVLHLAGLTNLEWLNLDNVTYLSDDGLTNLKDMTKLKFLHLGSTAITDDGLHHLAPLTSLDDLKVTRTGVTEAGVAELKKTLTKTEIQLKYIADQ